MPEAPTPTPGPEDQSVGPQPVQQINGSDRPKTSKSKSEPEPESSSESELDLESYRVDQDFTAHIQTVKKVLSIPVQRPDKQDWICIHPDKHWRIAVNLLDDKINRRVYLVSRNLVPEVTSDLQPKLLVAYATRRGSYGLWPIRLAGERGDLDSYNESAHAIVMQYAGQWIRVLTNQVDKMYEVLETAKIELPAPKWPESFQFIFKLAFRNRVVNSLDHPVLRSLRGEV
jgi:hypothetical protein